MQHHPTAILTKESESLFKECAEAYEVLCDPGNASSTTARDGRPQGDDFRHYSSRRMSLGLSATFSAISSASAARARLAPRF